MKNLSDLLGYGIGPEEVVLVVGGVIGLVAAAVAWWVGGRDD